jgi:hypothetical protein
MFRALFARTEDRRRRPSPPLSRTHRTQSRETVLTCAILWELGLTPRNARTGRPKMTVRNPLFTFVFLSAAFCWTAADAQLGKPTVSRPATANDLAGKKICWNDGQISVFGADGQYSNDRGKQRGGWLVTEPGVVKAVNKYRQYSILPDGSFYRHWFNGGGGEISGHAEQWGTVCN